MKGVRYSVRSSVLSSAVDYTDDGRTKRASVRFSLTDATRKQLLHGPWN